MVHQRYFRNRRHLFAHDGSDWRALLLLLRRTSKRRASACSHYRPGRANHRSIVWLRFLFCSFRFVPSSIECRSHLPSLRRFVQRCISRVTASVFVLSSIMRLAMTEIALTTYDRFSRVPFPTPDHTPHLSFSLPFLSCSSTSLLPLLVPLQRSRVQTRAQAARRRRVRHDRRHQSFFDIVRLFVVLIDSMQFATICTNELTRTRTNTLAHDDDDDDRSDCSRRSDAAPTRATMRFVLEGEKREGGVWGGGGGLMNVEQRDG